MRGRVDEHETLLQPSRFDAQLPRGEDVAGGDVAELEARRGDESPGDASIHPGDRDTAVLHAALQPLAAEEIELSSIELLASLVAPADAEADVLERLRVNVYRDRDGDGSVGTADELPSTGSFSESGRALALELEALALAAGGREHLLIALDLEPTPAGAALAATVSLATLGLYGLLWRRRPRLFAVAALALALIPLAACRPQSAPLLPSVVQLQLSLTGLTSGGAASGAPVSVSGLPLDGATVSISE